MTVGDKIREVLKRKGLTQRWLANMMNLNEKTLSSKFSQGSLSADELIGIGSLLGYDLNKFKKGSVFMIKYFNILSITVSLGYNQMTEEERNQADQNEEQLYNKLEMLLKDNKGLCKVISDEEIIYKVDNEVALSEIIGHDLKRYGENFETYIKCFADTGDYVEVNHMQISKRECVYRILPEIDKYEERIYNSDSPSDEIGKIIVETLRELVLEKYEQFKEYVNSADFKWE